MTRRLLLLAGSMALAGACDSPADPPPIVEPEWCRGEPVGMEHGGLIESPAVWRAADGPHLVVGRVQVDRLTIEAGALVCGAPGGEIWLRGTGALTAIGSEAAPIILTAQDSLQPWRGIAAGSVRLSHALVEHAQVGVGQTDSVIIDHSVRRTSISPPAKWRAVAPSGSWSRSPKVSGSTTATFTAPWAWGSGTPPPARWTPATTGGAIRRDPMDPMAWGWRAMWSSSPGAPSR